MSDSLFGLGSLVTSGSRTRFAGPASGIPTQKLVDGILKPQQERIDRIETQVEKNNFKIDALNNLRSRVNKLKQAASELNGSITLDNSGNAFENKILGQATSSRFDSESPSDPGQILGVTLSNEARVTDHQLEVLQTARAEKVSSNTFSSATEALGDGDEAEAGSGSEFAGEFTISTQQTNDVTVSVSNSDSLLDVRDKINNADAGVSASVVEISNNKFQLVVESEKTGTNNTLQLQDTTNDPLKDLGILDASGNKNITQEAQNARFTADNVKEQQVALSERVADPSQTILSSDLVESNSDFSLDVTNGAGTQSINVDVDNDTLNNVATKLDGLTDIKASVTADNELRVESTNGNVSFDDNGSTFLENTNLNAEIFTRQSNTVDDVFDGVTLNFRKAEDGTTVNLPIERDLSSVKKSINNFVDAFNNVKRFLNAQRQEEQLEGQSEDTVGVLKGDQILDDVQQRLNRMVGGVAENVDTKFSVLREIGIDFRKDENVSDPLNLDTLKVNSSELDNKLTNNFEAVRNLFRFNFQSRDPALSVFDFTGSTGGVSGFELNAVTDGEGDLKDATTLTDSSGNAQPFKILEDSNGENTSTLRVTGGPAEGLELAFTDENANRTAIFDTSVGIGAKSFFGAQNIAKDQDTGLIESEINRIERENENKNERLDRLETQLENERKDLIQRFSRLEGTLAQLGQQQRILQARFGSGSN